MNISRMKHSINLMDKVASYPKETPFRLSSGVSKDKLNPMYLPSTIEGIKEHNRLLLLSGETNLMSASWGSYLALSRMFRREGGGISTRGYPTYNDREAGAAICEWLDIPYQAVQRIANITSRCIYTVSDLGIVPKNLVTASMVSSVLRYYIRNETLKDFTVSKSLASRAGFTGY